MQISLININEIKQAHRFDAEYFKSVYLENDKIISIKKWKRCSEIVSSPITKGETPLWQGFNYINRGVPFVRSQNFKNFVIDKTDLVFVSEEYNKLKKRSIIKYGDILIAIVGATIGNVSIYDLKEDGNCNQAVAIISPKQEISKWFFYILMKTKNIQLQISRTQGGNARDNFDLLEVRNLKIPILPHSFQTQIESLVKQAHAKQEQSKQLYKEAEKILLQELDLLNYVPQNNLIFSTTKKHIEKIKRFDAEYFQPKYKKIIEKIELYKGGVEQIKNIVKWEKGVEVGADCYVEKGFDFVRVSDFNKYGINEIEKKISDKTYHEFKEKFEPKIGDILFTKDGTIGMSYVLKENIQGLLSGAFLRLTLKKEYKDFEKESLVLILNSIVCKMQVEQLSGGALIAHLKPSDFETFKIPLIKKEIQTNIAEKIKLSFSLKKESKELLEKAKKLVELEIEK